MYNNSLVLSVRYIRSAQFRFMQIGVILACWAARSTKPSKLVDHTDLTMPYLFRRHKKLISNVWLLTLS